MQLIHYTDCRNLEKIRESRTLRCALSLMMDGEKRRYSKVKRGESLVLTRAVIRDQQPLCERICFEDDKTTLAEYIKYLNGHVFFWPCVGKGEECRQTFRTKYPHHEHIGLRCQLSDLRAANPSANILFSRYNSGSTPRDPKRSPRNLNLFQPLASCAGKARIEIVVRGSIQLPPNTQVEYKQEKWRAFFPADLS